MANFGEWLSITAAQRLTEIELMKKFVAFFCALILCSSGSAMARPLVPYHSGDWSKLMAQVKGKRAIIHIWGFSCGPCVDELPAWGNFAATHPELQLTLLEVDIVPEEMTVKTLIEAKLINADNRVTVEYFDDYMRFEIDPKWMGELPITLLIDANGSVKKLRGSVNFKAVNEWAMNKGEK